VHACYFLQVFWKPRIPISRDKPGGLQNAEVVLIIRRFRPRVNPLQTACEAETTCGDDLPGFTFAVLPEALLVKTFR
jgi:hypothetical protein